MWRHKRSCVSDFIKLNDSSNVLQMMGHGAAVVALGVLLKHVSGALYSLKYCSGRKSLKEDLGHMGGHWEVVVLPVSKWKEMHEGVELFSKY